MLIKNEATLAKSRSVFDPPGTGGHTTDRFTPLSNTEKYSAEQIFTELARILAVE
jgi:hypothetical protein